MCPYILTDTCVVLWNHEEKAVSSLPTKTIGDSTYYLLAEGNELQRLLGISYQSGDKLYLKKEDKNEIIKEDFDHYRAMAKVYVYNENNKNNAATTRSNLLHVRCWDT